MRKLTPEEVKAFIAKFEIKCKEVAIVKQRGKYYIIIDNRYKFRIENIELIKEYL